MADLRGLAWAGLTLCLGAGCADRRDAGAPPATSTVTGAVPAEATEAPSSAAPVETVAPRSFPSPATAAEQARIEAAVRAQLKDPASAQFQALTLLDAKGSACGQVNSKNSQGGYTGFEYFWLTPGQGRDAIVVDTAGNRMAQTVCQVGIGN